MPSHPAYSLFPPRRPSEPGFAQLQAVLRSSSDEGHGLDQIRLTVSAGPAETIHPSEQAQSPGIYSLEVVHPWPGGAEYRVCAGQVEVIDHADTNYLAENNHPVEKRLEVFTFGGVLIISESEIETSVTLASPAPILVLYSMNAVSSLLAQEAEIFLSQRRAAWGDEPVEKSHPADINHPQAFEHMLATVDPLTLYLACLGAIRERFVHYPMGSDSILRFKYMVKAEIEAVSDLVSSLETAQLEKLFR